MSVRIENGRLFIDFQCYLPDGARVRCREFTGLKDNKKNRRMVQAKEKSSQYELKHGHFDYLHFFPDGSKAKIFRRKPEDTTLKDWWDTWISEKSIRANTLKGWESSYRVHILTT